MYLIIMYCKAAAFIAWVTFQTDCRNRGGLEARKNQGRSGLATDDFKQGGFLIQHYCPGMVLVQEGYIAANCGAG